MRTWSNVGLLDLQMKPSVLEKLSHKGQKVGSKGSMV